LLALSILAPLEKIMPLKTMQLFFQVILTNLLLIPFSVSATVFNPLEDININLTGDTTFNYDTFTLNQGLTLNYFAPENSVIEIISEGDIFIGGDLKLSPNSKLILNSKKGDLKVTGTLFSSALHLKGTEDHIDFSSSNFDSYPKPIVLEGGLILSTLSFYAISSHPEPIYNWHSGSSSSTTMTLSTPILIMSLPTTVPLPAPIWLFSTALLSLFTLRKAKI